MLRRSLLTRVKPLNKFHHPLFKTNLRTPQRALSTTSDMLNQLLPYITPAVVGSIGGFCLGEFYFKYNKPSNNTNSSQPSLSKVLQEINDPNDRRNYILSYIDNNPFFPKNLEELTTLRLVDSYTQLNILYKINSYQLRQAILKSSDLITALHHIHPSCHEKLIRELNNDLNNTYLQELIKKGGGSKTLSQIINLLVEKDAKETLIHLCDSATFKSLLDDIPELTKVINKFQHEYMLTFLNKITQNNLCLLVDSIQDGKDFAFFITSLPNDISKAILDKTSHRHLTRIFSYEKNGSVTHLLNTLKHLPRESQVDLLENLASSHISFMLHRHTDEPGEINSQSLFSPARSTQRKIQLINLLSERMLKNMLIAQHEPEVALAQNFNRTIKSL